MAQPSVPRVQRGQPSQLLAVGAACLALAAGSQVLWLNTLRGWASLALLAPSAWFFVRWWLVWRRLQVSRAIGNRLSRLPADFIILNNLVVPAPWGYSQLDHLIVSRFGLVVVADGPSTDWLMEQIEAVRSLLVSRGLSQASLPIRPLILLPPGASEARQADGDTPVIRVEYVRLTHIAPSSEPVMTPDQVNAIAHYLLHLQQAA